ncbi:Uncharacterized protein Fot_00763 [Forsythia ovata]|uniref:Uncharacterized protein n=1 Tax=Forsythia ovata TaxID=205694 RepID=A0ABD1X2A3_9LAMI
MEAAGRAANLYDDEGWGSGECLGGRIVDTVFKPCAEIKNFWDFDCGCENNGLLCTKWEKRSRRPLIPARYKSRQYRKSKILPAIPDIESQPPGNGASYGAFSGGWRYDKFFFEFWNLFPRRRAIPGPGPVEFWELV